MTKLTGGNDYANDQVRQALQFAISKYQARSDKM